MAPAAREVLGLIAAVVVGAGPVLGLFLLLNRRDRRRLALLDCACGQFPSAALRSDVAVTAWAGLGFRRAAVLVDLGLSSRDEVWAAITRLRRALPPEVRLIVDGRLDRRQPARLTVESRGEASLRPAA